jgi:hypothetical protein
LRATDGGFVSPAVAIPTDLSTFVAIGGTAFSAFTAIAAAIAAFWCCCTIVWAIELVFGAATVTISAEALWLTILRTVERVLAFVTATITANGPGLLQATAANGALEYADDYPARKATEASLSAA